VEQTSPIVARTLRLGCAVRRLLPTVQGLVSPFAAPSLGHRADQPGGAGQDEQDAVGRLEPSAPPAVAASSLFCKLEASFFGLILTADADFAQPERGWPRATQRLWRRIVNACACHLHGDNNSNLGSALAFNYDFAYRELRIETWGCPPASRNVERSATFSQSTFHWLRPSCSWPQPACRSSP
jgi:hypothetical protein